MLDILDDRLGLFVGSPSIASHERRLLPIMFKSRPMNRMSALQRVLEARAFGTMTPEA
jgi:hypothetical protein